MTKTEVQVTFGGVSLGKFFRVVDVRRPILAERDIETNSAPALGVNVQRVKRSAKTIEIDIRLKTADGQSMETLKHQLAKVLDVDQATRLEFSDEPDKYYKAITAESIDLDNVVSWLQKGTIVFLIPDGVAHSTTYKRVSAGRNDNGRIVFDITNDGNHPARPIFKIKNNSENGYLGFVNSTGAMEVGNPEEGDTEMIQRSELLFDYRDDKIVAGFNAGQKNVGKFNDQLDTLNSQLVLKDEWGRKHIALGRRGGTTRTNNAGSITFNIPADSNGSAGSLNDYIWWRQIFWAGRTDQVGYMKVSVTTETGEFLYGVETYKRGFGTHTEYNIQGSDGKGSYKLLRQFTFRCTHLNSQNPFNHTRGWSDMRRVDDTVTFFWWGSYLPFTIPAIKGKKSAKIHVAIGGLGQRPLVHHLYLDSIFYQKNHVNKLIDVPNAFPIGSTVEVNGETDTVLVNGLASNNRVVYGSTWPTIPTGKSTLEAYYSSWANAPEIQIEFEELY